MYVGDAVQALRDMNIEIALDTGAHFFCNLESNCPVAIKLRTIIQEAKVNPAELLNSFATRDSLAQESIKDKIKLEFDPDKVTTQASVIIGDTTIPVNILDIARNGCEQALYLAQEQLKKNLREAETVKQGLITRYMHEIAAMRNHETLSQLQFPLTDMIKYGAFVTAFNNAEYEIGFKVEYHPTMLIIGDSVYRIIEEHEKILIDSCILVFRINRNYRIVKAILLDRYGQKKRHYHGTTYDCWGDNSLDIPRFNLDEIYLLKERLIRSLAAINTNSVVSRNPASNMVELDKLEEKAIYMDKQSEVVIKPAAEVTTETVTTTWN